MKNFAPSPLTRLLAVTAVLTAILFTVGQASAGTQMPYWKKMQLQNTYNATNTPGTPGTNPGDNIVVVDEVTPPANGDNGQPGDQYTPGDTGGGSGGQGPKAVPTPSAVAGGLAMIGLIAGRRRRHEQQEA